MIFFFGLGYTKVFIVDPLSNYDLNTYYVYAPSMNLILAFF